MEGELDVTSAEIREAFRDALAINEPVTGPDILTTREMCGVTGLQLSRTRELIKLAVEAGRMERVLTRRDGRTVPGYRVIGNGKEPE